MEKKRPPHFFDKPQYPGGTTALRAFINAHLQYPQDALKQQIEGVVAVAYQVSDEGEVENPIVLKGLSPSCDSEAIRLVKLLKYSKVRNRGVRIKSNCKVNIHFKLPRPKQTKTTINYHSSSKTPDNTTQNEGGSYSVTIQWH